MAERLGFFYVDEEIVARAAAKAGIDPREVADGSRAGHLLDLATPNSACLLLAAAGLLLLLGQGWGVYLFAAAVIVVLVGGTANAWLLLVITD